VTRFGARDDEQEAAGDFMDIENMTKVKNQLIIRTLKLRN
jgi:hypothetical protein